MTEWFRHIIQSLLHALSFIPVASSALVPATTVIPTLYTIPSIDPMSFADPIIATSSVTQHADGSTILVTVDSGGIQTTNAVTQGDGTGVTQSITTGNASARASQTGSGNGQNTITIEVNSGENQLFHR